ncbi:MAG: hypothetical protein SPJ84_02690 [Fusobacterium gastrosuis]|uniref:hypothetical protein n=1 Tax=Fusobacterium TaxID=848 RepID=UPI0025C5040E|nr:hypothetical protein [Fusobacterium sp.]MCI7224324.1 hypothetical protein [Fusobacterium sp.]MDY5794712.1 hypothetical protein [Fusobacterium gastrosuis]
MISKNAETVYNIIKNQQGILNSGYINITNSAISKETNLTIDEVKEAKFELIKNGHLFFRNIEQNIGAVDLQTGEIKAVSWQRLYIDKEVFQKDVKEIRQNEVKKLTESFIKHSERINNIKGLSNEAITIYSLIEVSKKNLAFSNLTLKEMENITGLSGVEIKNAKKELVDNKLIYEVGIPLKEPYKYKVKDENGIEHEKEMTMKTVYITNTEVLSKVIKSLEQNKEKTNSNIENRWDKAKVSPSIAD